MVGLVGSYKVEIADKKDPLSQIEASKSSIKDLFKDLLDEINQITVKASLIKHKGNGGIESADVYFNTITKAMINFKHMLDKSFQEILYRIDNLINEGSGWMSESVDTKYVNISIYSPLSGGTDIKLPRKLRKSVTINVFFWCHIRHLNPLKIHPERIAKADKNMVNDLDYKGIERHTSF